MIERETSHGAFVGMQPEEPARTVPPLPHDDGAVLATDCEVISAVVERERFEEPLSRLKRRDEQTARSNE